MSKQTSFLIKVLTVLLVVVVVTFLPRLGNRLHNLYLRTLNKSIVKVLGERGGGTGFLIKGASGKPYIITNTHVCNLATDKKLSLYYNNEYFAGTVYKHYAMNDLCAVKTEYSGRPLHLSLLPSFVGEEVFSIGYPLLEPLAVTSGEISGYVTLTMAVSVNTPEEECSGLTYMLQMAPPMAQLFGVQSICFRQLMSYSSSVLILPGNSGSPLVDIWGGVVGVVFAANQGNRGYHVPHHDLKKFLEEL